MKMHAPQIVQYVVGSVKKEIVKLPSNFVEWRIVVCAHDETTAQANDCCVKSWIFEDQHSLWKKGAGWGIHQSDVICSTVRWLKNASQTLEYGKNYEGYWTGELFVKQVSVFQPVFAYMIDQMELEQLHEKIIPAFKQEHRAGYQVLIMVDNSQGHSAYSEDALLTMRMNVNPGGKQA